jgi:hypothetical protein
VQGIPGETQSKALAIDATTRAKTKYRDLSTAQRTIRPSLAPVEMTLVLGWVERTACGEKRGKRGLLRDTLSRLIHATFQQKVLPRIFPLAVVALNCLLARASFPSIILALFTKNSP